VAHGLLTDPMGYVDRKSKKKDYKDGFIFSIYNSILIGAAMLLIHMLTGVYSVKSLMISFWTGIAVMLLAHYFGAYLIWEFLRFIKRNTSYFAILSLIGYMLFYIAMAVAFTIMLLPFPFLNLIAPFIGIVLVTRSLGVFFRFLKDYADLSIVESFVVLIVVALSISIWVYWIFQPLSLFL